MSKLKLSLSKTTKLPMAVAQVYSLDVMNGKRSINKYVTNVIFRKSERVKVSCSCPDHMYRFEWALWKKGAADLVYSNGEAPDITNPGYLGGCCKHVVALWFFLETKKLIRPAQNYANKVRFAKDDKSKDLYNLNKPIK